MSQHDRTHHAKIATGKGDPQCFAGTAGGPPKFKVGDRVRIKDMPDIFYTRCQVYTRGAVGEVAVVTHESPAPGRRGLGARGSSPSGSTSCVSSRRISGLNIRQRLPMTLCRRSSPSVGSRRFNRPIGTRIKEGNYMSHDHDHNAPAPMVDEISDFEALEIAVREIVHREGAVLRRRSPQIHRVRRAHRADPGGPHGRQGLAGPRVQEAGA
jgi:hypothetical protein